MTFAIDDLPPRLAGKLMPEPTTGCWLWIGAASRGERCGGYGSVRDGGSSRQAHRVVWEKLVGPLDGDVTLDHVQARGCSSILCCNPTHLEPVSRGENNRRSRCWHHFLDPNVRRAAVEAARKARARKRR